MRFLLLLFIVMPIVEMWVLITVGSTIGAINTISLVLLTALIGIFLLREQGLETLWRGREKLQQGRVPAQEMAEAIVLAVSGALLITPGFVTDSIGFAGLIPICRQTFVNALLSRIKITNLRKNGSNFTHADPSMEGDTIDGESWDVNDGSKNLRDR